ncbi:LIC_12616 family protein [Burkholderia territorii]|uniref:phage neck terminator protein n=1 Tax=Burkholderia territorii TaxID=1503055 RepID=UPI000B20FE9E|nr:hypothetical protein [Burkholderia territorii]
MSLTLSIAERDAFQALRSFLIAILPDGTEVVKNQGNRVPEPTSDDFVRMTPLFRDRIETNVTTYRDGYPSGPSVKDVLQPTKFTVQLDVHGPASGDNAQLITTLFRDEYAVDQFAAAAPGLAPLYSSEARQIPFTNGEQQIETRWTVDLVMQINPVVTVPQEFADKLEIGTAGNPVTATTKQPKAWSGLKPVDTAKPL